MTTLRSVLTAIGVNVVRAVDSRRALDLLSSEAFDAVFCDRAAGQASLFLLTWARMRSC